MTHPAGTGLRAAAAAAALYALGTAAYAAHRQDVTADEGDHLSYSRRLLEHGETDRYYLHYNSKTPVMIPNVLARWTAKRHFDLREQRDLRLVGRLPSLVWLALLLSGVWLAARAWVSEEAAALAVVLTALDPNIVANSSVATTDVAYALATLATLAAAHAFAARPGAGRGAVLGLALGFAFATKFTAFLLLPCVALALLPPFRPTGGGPGRGQRIAGGLLLAAAVAWAVVCAAYLFKGMGEPLSSRPWLSPFMKPLASSLPGLRLPVPIDFLTGVDVLVTSDRYKEWPVDVLGSRHADGVWYYFVFHWLLKTPVLLVLAQIAGLTLLLRRGDLGAGSFTRYAGACFVLFLLYVSFVLRAQLGYRLALMCIPLGAILAAGGLSRLRRPALLAAGVIAASVLEQAPYLGNHLAFTNAAVQPKETAYRLLSGANLDWGQSDWRVAEWLAKNPGAHYGRAQVLPGRNVFSVSALYAPQFSWVGRRLEPGGHIGFTHVWFDVDEAAFAGYLEEERTLRADPGAAELCAEARPVPAGRLLVNPPADGRNVRVLCLEAPSTATLLLRGVAGGGPSGRLHVGGPRQRRKHWPGLSPGDVVWYRLEPGSHVLAFVAYREPVELVIEADPPVAASTGDARLDGRGYVLPPP